LGRERHRGGGLLRHLRLREGAQRHEHLGLRFPQDAGDLVRLKERVDRVDDARDLAAEVGEDRLRAVGQEVRDRVPLAHAERAEQVRRLRHAALELGPGEGLGRGLGVGQELEAEGVPRPMPGGGAVEERPGGARQVEIVEGPLGLDGDAVGGRGEGHAFLPFGPRLAAASPRQWEAGGALASPGIPYSAAIPSVNWSRARRA
jgi:hypothetical protein